MIDDISNIELKYYHIATAEPQEFHLKIRSFEDRRQAADTLKALSQIPRELMKKQEEESIGETREDGFKWT